MCLEVDESTFIKEVTDICQRGLLKENPFKQILICQQMTYQELGKIREFEPRWDASYNK